MSKKAIASLTLASILVVSMIVGGATLALFTSSATNEDNNFTAGTINLVAERNYGDYLPGPIFYPNSLDPDGLHPYDALDQDPSGESMGGWAPGDTVTRLMRLKNEGTLDAKLTGLKATPRDTFTHNTPYSGDRTVNGLISGAAFDEFVQKANVTVKNGSVLLYDGPLSSLIFNDPNSYAPVLNEIIIQAPPPPPHSGGFQNLEIEVTLDRTAGNVLQGETFIFDIGFYAEQVRNNDGSDPGDETTGTISGTITLYQYWNFQRVPVEGAVIEFYRENAEASTLNQDEEEPDFTTISGPNGSYSIDLPPGEYYIRVQHPTERAFGDEDDVIVEVGETVTIDISMYYPV